MNQQMVMTRRGLVGLSAGAAAIAALAACSPAGAGGGSAGGGKLVLPTFKAAPEVKGAIAPANSRGPLGFVNYPTPFQSVKQTPGSGGTVKTFQLIWGSPPPGGDSNSWTKAMSKAMGVDYQPTYTPNDNFEQKLATVIAGGDLPDLTWMRPLSSAAAAKALSQGAFANLNDALGGDAVLEYPNLANIPTQAWERSAFRGNLLGIPRPLYAMNRLTTWREDWADQLGLSKTPSTPEEVFEIQKAFSNKERWAYGSVELLNDAPYSQFYSMFGVPNGWSESGGKFTNFIETDEFEAALEYMRESWDAGHFHPDSLLNQTQLPTLENLFYQGKVGFRGSAPLAWFRATVGELDKMAVVDPSARPGLFTPPGNAGKKPVFYETPGWYGFASIPAKVAQDKERLKELLRVADFMAAPFGSKEYTLMVFGVEGRHYTLDDKGNPIPSTNAQIGSELNGNYFIEPSETSLYFPGTTGRVEAAQAYVSNELDSSGANAANGRYSATLIEKSATLNQINNSYQNDIVSGRKPVSALKNWRQDWAAAGGSKIRSEFEADLAKTKN